MSNFVDITGKKFNRLRVIKRVENSKDNKSMWLCVCDCGNTKIVSGVCLKNNSVKSCGCFNYEKRHSQGTHKKSYTRLYGIWSGIKTRCYNQNCKAYKNYGGRSITMFDKWKNSFEDFYEWSLKNNYKEDLTIDRIDVNGNYEPSNCRWITAKKQHSNMRKSIRYVDDETEYCLSELCRKYNMPYLTVYNRIKKSNMSIKDALTKPINTNKRNKLYKGGINI